MSAPTLTEFVLARIAEREAVALAATMGPWFAVASGVEGAGTVLHDKHVLHNDAAHIALHDPARELRRCAADRRIVEGMRDGEIDDLFAPEILGHLAEVDDDHPDFRDEWRS